MSNTVDWSKYVLRLTRETSEYQSGSWYNHSWNEKYQIVEYAETTCRGETIRIDNIEGEVIHITFFDEKTPKYGVYGVVSLQNPKDVLRNEHAQGGSNEFVWERNDCVVLTLELKEN
jgi:hypothetical protein